MNCDIFGCWEKLTKQMAPLPVLNRAFGGSRMAEVLHYMDKIVLPYKPKIIAYCLGGNDTDAKVTPKPIEENFRQFVTRVHKELPQTNIFFGAIDGAPEKMGKWAQVNEANKLVKTFCATNNKLGYIFPSGTFR